MGLKKMAQLWSNIYPSTKNMYIMPTLNLLNVKCVGNISNPSVLCYDDRIGYTLLQDILLT